MPDNEQNIGSSSERVEDLVEKINATSDVKEMVRNLVKFTESHRQQMLKRRLEYLVESGKEIKRKEVEYTAEILGALDFFTLLEKQEKEEQEKEDIEGSSKTPGPDLVGESGNDTSPYWN